MLWVSRSKLAFSKISQLRNWRSSFLLFCSNELIPPVRGSEMYAFNFLEYNLFIYWVFHISVDQGQPTILAISYFEVRRVSLIIYNTPTTHTLYWKLFWAILLQNQQVVLIGTIITNQKEPPPRSNYDCCLSTRWAWETPHLVQKEAY